MEKRSETPLQASGSWPVPALMPSLSSARAGPGGLSPAGAPVLERSLAHSGCADSPFRVPGPAGSSPDQAVPWRVPAVSFACTPGQRGAMEGKDFLGWCIPTRGHSRRCLPSLLPPESRGEAGPGQE